MGSFRSALIGLIGALLIGCGFSVSSAWAGYTVTLMQQGPNVIATGSGAIDLTNLIFTGTTIFPDIGVEPSAGVIATGPRFSQAAVYIATSGPTSFGSGGITPVTSGSGDFVAIAGAANFLYLPVGYVSGTPLSDTSTYDNATFSSLGVTPGTYEWTWGTGQNQNFTLIAVPEPRVGLLLGAGLLVLLGARLRQLRFGPGAA